jgi:hypothetical protein
MWRDGSRSCWVPGPGVDDEGFGVGSQGVPQAADNRGIKTTSHKLIRRSLLGSCLLIGLLVAPLAHAGANGPDCEMDFHRRVRKSITFPARIEFTVRAAGHRLGAIGIWENRAGDDAPQRVRLRVKPGGGKRTKWLTEGEGKRTKFDRREYRLIRCETT